MSQYVDNHSLAQDLPEFRQAIHDLKKHNSHFSRLLGKYETLDKNIVRVEQGLEYLPDLELDALKLERVQLKDNLVNLLKNTQ